MIKLGLLTQASKLSMTDDDLSNYFTACLEGTEMAMECVNTAWRVTASLSLMTKMSGKQW